MKTQRAPADRLSVHTQVGKPESSDDLGTVSQNDASATQMEQDSPEPDISLQDQVPPGDDDARHRSRQGSSLREMDDPGGRREGRQLILEMPPEDGLEKGTITRVLTV